MPEPPEPTTHPPDYLRWVADAIAWEVNYRDGRTYYSRRLRQILGEPTGADFDAMDCGGLERVHPEDRQRLTDALERAVAEGREQLDDVEFRLRAADGSYRWIHSVSRIVEWFGDGRPARVVGWHTDIAERKRMEEAIRATTRKVERLTGEAFFRSLVQSLAEVLGVGHCFIGRLLPGRRVRTVAAYSRGSEAADFEYSLAGAPCEHTLDGQLCYYPRDVATLFPLDGGLRKRRISSYMGMGLTGLEGQSMGLIVVMDEGPLERETLARTLLPLFAARAAVELERLAAEESRQSSAQQYRLLFEHLISACALLDPVKDASGRIVDFRYVETNPAFESMTQLKSRDIQGRTIREVILGVEDHWIEGMARVAETGEPMQFEEYSRNYDRWYELRAFKPDDRHLAILFNDVTERRRVEQSLRESERTLRELFDNTSLAGFVSALDGVVLYCNEAALSLIGLPATQVVGRRWPERFISADEHAEILGAVARIGGDWEKLPRHWRSHVIHTSGSRRLVEWDVSPVYDPTGKLVSIACLGRDLTLWEELEEQYRQAHKMEAIGRLAGGIAHDFNNILTVINGYSSLALARLYPNDPAYLSILEIQKAGERAAGLTRQLLAFSRKQILQTRSVDLNRVVSDALGMLSRLIGAHIEIESRLAGELGAVRADPTQMMQVVMNLAVNARDAIHESGHIVIRTENLTVPPEGDPAFPSAPPGDFVCLTVLDDGAGMDEETQRHMFEPFFTTKPPGQGTGLGLATVYGIVRQSGGFIGVRSRVGEGTAIRILLPRVPAEIEAAGAAPAQVALFAEAHVFLVEDQDSVRDFLRTILVESGFEVTVAPNGEHALGLLRDGLRPQVLVTDIVMPGMNGPALAAQARDLIPGLKVILISGYAPTHEDTSCDLYLQKPFTGDVLLNAVRHVLSGGARS